jgi:predicted ATPase
LARNDPTGLTLLRGGLAWLREARFSRHYVSLLGTLAQGLGAAGRTAEAHSAIDEGIERAESSEELWCLPEQLRIKDEILRLEGLSSADEGAEQYFQKALALARQQQALSWELRAATSLAKLWREDGRAAEAGQLLSGVYERFTEGFDTLDLRTTRQLINELRGNPAS